MALLIIAGFSNETEMELEYGIIRFVADDTMFYLLM